MGTTGIKETALAAVCVVIGGATLFGQLFIGPAPESLPPAPETARTPAPVHYAEAFDPSAFQTDAAISPAPELAHPSAPEPKLDLRKLAVALVQIESAGNPDRVGLHGERGLMQIKPRTWEAVTTRLYGRPLDFNRAFEKELNLKVGTAYLEELHTFLATHREDWQATERDLLLACYNAGPTRVQSACFDMTALPVNTQDYVARACALADCE